MSLGIWQIAIIAIVVVLLFGRGKISDLMGDVAKGINSFKKGLKDEEAAEGESQSNSKQLKRLTSQPPKKTTPANRLIFCC